MPLKTYDDFALATQYAFYKICENAGVKYDEKLNKDFKAILDGVNQYNNSISTKAYEQRKALVKDIQIADLCEKNQISYDPKIAKAFREILENNGQYKATDTKLLAELTPEQKQIEKLCQANNIKYTPQTAQALETIFAKTKNTEKITLNSDFGFAEGRDAANAGKIIDKTQIVAKESEFVPMFNQEEIKNYRALSKNIDPNASKTDITAAKTDISIRVLSDRYRPQLETDPSFLADKSRQQGKLSDYIQKQNQVITNIYKELDVNEIKDILKRNNVPRSPYYNQDLQFLPTINKLAKNTKQQLKDLFKDNNIPADKLKQTEEQVSGLVRNYINAVSPEASIIASDKLPKNYHENFAKYAEDKGNEILKEQYPSRVTSTISQELASLKEYIQDSKKFPTFEPKKHFDLKEKFNQITVDLDLENPSKSVANKIDSYQKYCAELETELTNSLENTKMNRRDVAKKALPALGKTLLNALKLDAGKARQEMNKFTTENQDRKNQRENLETTIENIQTIAFTLEKAKPALDKKISTLKQEILASNKQQINERAEAQLTKETMLADAKASKNNDLQHFINRTKDIAGITTQDLEKGVEQSAKMAPVSNKKSPLQNRLSQANASAGIPVKRTVVPRKSALASNIVTNSAEQKPTRISPLAANPISNEQVANSPQTPLRPAIKPIGQRRPLPARKSLNKGQGQNPQAQASNAAAAEPLKPSNELAIKKPEGYTSQDRSNIPKSRLSQKQASQGGKQFGALRGSVGLSNNNLSPNVPKQEKQQTNWTIPQGQSARIDALWKKLQNRPETKFLTEGGKANPSSLQKELLLRNNLAQYKHDIRNASLVASNLPPMESKQFTTKSIAELKSMPKLPTKDTKAIEFAVKALDALDKVNTIDDPNKRNPYAKVDSYLKRIDNLDKPDLLEQATKLAKDKILQQASKLAQNILKSPATNQQQQNGKPGTANSRQSAIIAAKNIGSDLTSKQANHVSPQPGANAIIPSHKPRGRGGR